MRRELEEWENETNLFKNSEQFHLDIIEHIEDKIAGERGFNAVMTADDSGERRMWTSLQVGDLLVKFALSGEAQEIADAVNTFDDYLLYESDDSKVLPLVLKFMESGEDTAGVKFVIKTDDFDEYVEEISFDEKSLKFGLVVVDGIENALRFDTWQQAQNMLAKLMVDRDGTLYMSQFSKSMADLHVVPYLPQAD
jgi:hypothetical protein